MKIIPVILCGGSGTRLWPLSREEMPKQFLRLIGNTSLLQDTLTRAMAVSGAVAHEVVTVTTDAVRRNVVTQMVEVDADSTLHILGEPVARNTAAAIAYAARYTQAVFGDDAVLWVMPSDHHMGDLGALKQALDAALAAARDGALVTFGINPTRAETGYGYIKQGDAANQEGVYRAAQFVEKPDAQTAQSYVDSGAYLWNSGMFVLPVATLIAEFESYAPEVLAGVKAAMGQRVNVPLSLEAYSKIPSMPFDKAVMEKSARVCVVPCDPKWSDIGSFESLWDVQEKDPHGNVTDGRVAAVDTRNSMIMSEGRLVACAGVDNVAVLDTGDAVLVADMRKPDSMRQLMATLKHMKVEEIVRPHSEKRPWGDFKVLGQASGYKLKEITVMPGQQLSLQMHNHRCEFWVVIEGEAEVTVNDTIKTYGPQQVAVIPHKAKHRMANRGTVPMRLVEVQCGPYLGEDDIIRFEDMYGRMAAE
jgi:mannose-1-phosphate guanylyltransferase / mannose-6-phosphate isomerase